jgi:hypothetical protein
LVAICRCGALIEALDLERAFVGHLWFSLQAWIRRGCTIEPRFGDQWGTYLEPCRCHQTKDASE